MPALFGAGIVEHRVARVVEIDRGIIDEILTARRLARRRRGPLQ